MGYIIGSLAFSLFVAVLLATQVATIRESIHNRRLDRSISVFIKNLNEGEFLTAAYQFHYLEAQAFGGIAELAEALSRFASETGNISYDPNDISHTRNVNVKVEYMASLKIDVARTSTGELVSIEILAYEESNYGGPTIAVFDGEVFKDPL